MKTTRKHKRRPAVLVRFYATDLTNLNQVCADACTPRENFIRRAVLEKVRLAMAPTAHGLASAKRRGKRSHP